MPKVAKLEEQNPPPAVPDDPPKITAIEAGRILGVGNTKRAELLKVGKQTGGKEGLPSETSPLDHRVVLVKQSDVEALRAASQGVTVREARKALGVGHEKLKVLIESGQLPVRSHPLYKRRKIVDPVRYQELLAERNAIRRALSSAHQQAVHAEEGL